MITLVLVLRYSVENRSILYLVCIIVIYLFIHLLVRSFIHSFIYILTALKPAHREFKHDLIYTYFQVKNKENHEREDNGFIQN